MNQKQIDEFIACLKKINHKSKTIKLPDKGECMRLESSSTKHHFLLDVNLKGKLGNITLQLRSKSFIDKPILRLDISGPSHPNPKGDFELSEQIIECPHMHIAHPDFGSAIAYPINHDVVNIHLTKEELDDLVIVLRLFLKYMNTGNRDDFIFQKQINWI